MEFEGIRVSAGRARGPAHLAPHPLDGGTGPSGSVLIVATNWWPPASFRPPAVSGIVLDGLAPLRVGAPSVPVVADLPSDLFREGEIVEIDGDRGSASVPGLRRVDVVTAFLERSDGKVLLLRRSERVGSFRGRWAGVSGYLEDPTAELQAIREIAEETGVAASDLSLERTGRFVYARKGATVYAVHPFRFRTRRSDVRLDWEHTESEWVDPAVFRERSTVPNLERAWKAVAPPVVQKG
ncbi:MAG: NUDIX domain-containing protein [Thermoplasmata archaeon]